MPASSTASSDAHALPPPSRSPQAFLRSVMPALECAFGVEADPDLPDELTALIARLQAGSEDGFEVIAAVPPAESMLPLAPVPA